MARKQHHEEHQNHEAWAIPYGDLVTLLLAFFVVMYAISSVNEGKYRVMADALSAAFGGTPRTISPIQLGQSQLRGSAFDRPSMQTAAAKTGPASVSPVAIRPIRQVLDVPSYQNASDSAGADAARAARSSRQLHSLGERIQIALSELVRKNLVTVRRGHTFLEVEIQSDILFASGVAVPSPLATRTVRQLAQVLSGEPNAVRVEGYTDNQPIHTVEFPSNWELSAARAGSVVHELIAGGVAPQRLAVVGYGEHQPIGDNRTVEGRNSNRRVLLVILAAPDGPDSVVDTAPPTMAMAEPPLSDPAEASPETTAATAPPPSDSRAGTNLAPLLPITATTVFEPDPGAG